ncbi:hypothetical protein ACHAXM_006026 [Skeletonema potamos]
MEQHNNSNTSTDNLDDPDDDLRSLLSDHSSNNKNNKNNNNNNSIINVPGSPSKQAGSKNNNSRLESDEVSLSSLLGEQMEHPHHPGVVIKGGGGGGQQKKQQQQGQHAHITYLASSSWDDNNNTMTTPNLQLHGHNSHHHPPMTRRKKLLTALGIIILCMGLVGPSGILWKWYDDETDEYSTGDSLKNTFKDVGAHSSRGGGVGVIIGDKHHHLPNGEMNNIGGNVWLRSNTKKRQNAFQPIRAEKKRKQRGGINNYNDNSHRGDDDTDISPIIHSNIKEAIANIDKVFLDEHPTYYNSVDATQKRQADLRERRKKQRQREKNQQRVGNFLGGLTKSGDNGSDSNNNNHEQRGGGNNDNDALDEDDDEFYIQEVSDENNLPVIHVSDNELPENAEALDTFTNSLPASEALECRASVIAFVINATDVKDECDGLRKAFDKTCSVQHSSASGGGGGGASTAAGGGGSGEGKGSAGGNTYAQRRRRLQERGKPHVSNFISEALQREVSNVKANVKLHMRRLWRWQWGDNDDIFKEREATWMAEMKVMTYRKLHLTEKEGRSVEEDKPQSIAEAIEGALPVQQQQKEQSPPPKISLNIPTAEKHISEETLNDALLLQESKTEEHKVPSLDQQPQQQVQEVMTEGEVSDAQPKDEATNAEAAVAAKDAAESAEAIRTATDAVKNIMNDPKSVEARTCCASILSVFHEHCDPTTTGVEDYSDRRLLVVVFVITVCGMVKSIIRYLNVRWLPEAGGCILVGVLGYVILSHMPHVQFAFDGDMFLRIMVPPIVFEAAVKINKQSFRRHAIPITIYAIIGTLASTAFTALILHKGSLMMKCTTIPIKESLIFGALISSIDPIAVLSVLNNMGMTDSDTIYVLIFGESLLNDGIAIVLFQTLVHFLDETLVVDAEVIFDAIMHFIVVAFGSLSVGMISGACATIYFATMNGCQTPLVECIMFFCWAIIPYYICDMVEWSGIVAIVANGFVMDLFVVGQKRINLDDEIEFLVNGTSNGSRARSVNRQQCRSFFNYEGHLSEMANNHVHFVIEIFATLMETAIFAYLGLFLFSSRYHWSTYLTMISIFATVMGRVIMIPTLSHVANIFNRIRGQRNRANSPRGEINDGVHVDRRMQLVLIFAGLRGAMSFALVEHIPMFDTTTGQGSRFKPELKSMTSASVIFTVFVLGGATPYLLERLGYSLTKEQNSVEITPLMQRHKKETPSQVRQGAFPSVRGIGSIRQRAQPR